MPNPDRPVCPHCASPMDIPKGRRFVIRCGVCQKLFPLQRKSKSNLVSLMQKHSSGHHQQSNDPVSSRTLKINEMVMNSSGSQKPGASGSHHMRIMTEPPEQLGPYRILKPLGRGGMGVVYSAHDLRLNREVALKIIRDDGNVPREDRLRFEQEAKFIAKLQHPNIVPLHDVGHEKGLQYFTMKLINGVTLTERLQQSDYSLEESVEVLEKVCRAIHHAHEFSVIHRDLKPDNILVDENGEPQVMDFGLARSQSQGSDLTMGGLTVGTPSYMAPEQAAGPGDDLGPPADIWGLGAILYEMLAGRPPFIGENIFQVMQFVVSEDPVEPRRFDPGIPEELEAICLKCLRKDPKKRYASAEKLADELGAWLSGEPISAKAISKTEKTTRYLKKHPVQSVAAVLLLGFVCAGSWMWNRNNQLDLEMARREKSELEARQNQRLEDLTIKVQRAKNLTARGRDCLTKIKNDWASLNKEQAETLLVEATDCFRAALFENPNYKDAKIGLMETGNFHFEAAVKAGQWNQAQEKILLMKAAGASKDTIETKQKQLKAAKSAEFESLRERVQFLMKDASQETNRKVPHEKAKFELISMADSHTTRLLATYVKSKNSNQQLLAMEALQWIGDSDSVEMLASYIDRKRPDKSKNPIEVQIAAFRAICTIAPENQDIYSSLRKRLKKEPGYLNSRLAINTQEFFKPYFHKMALQDQKHSAEDTKKGMNYRSYLIQANKCMEAGLWNKALEFVNKGIALKPEHGEAYGHRGNIYSSLGKIDKALVDYKTCEKLKFNSPDILLNRCQIYRMKKNHKAALRDVDRVLRALPNFHKALQVRSALKMDMKDPAGALKDINRAIQIQPNHTNYYFNRANIYAKLNNLDKCLHNLNIVLKLSPKFTPGYLMRGKVNLKNRNSQDALNDFNEVIAIDPTQFDAYVLRANIRRESWNFKGAVEDLRQAVNLKPNNPYAHLFLGGALFIQGNEDEAHKQFALAKSINPKFEQIVKSQLPLLKIEAEKYKKRTRVNKEPKTAKDYWERAESREKRGRLKEAEQDLIQAIKMDPKMKIGWLLAAEVREKRKQVKEAARAYRMAAEQLPNNVRALNEAAWFFLHYPDATPSDNKSALQWSKTAANLSPEKEKYMILDTYALALFKNGVYREAMEIQKEALRTLPKNLIEQHETNFKARLKQYEKAWKNSD